MARDRIALVIATRERDLGGFTVRRLLPYATHRMVGPFIFFDHMGPAVLAPGQGMDVRPHPHINLATVTYLFEGQIQHRDSLGSNQTIEPGAVNWMTAGKGIVHSERTPDPQRARGGRVHGIQLWVALPEADEESEPAFVHCPKESLPEFEITGVSLKLLLGEAYGRKSPVHVFSNLFYIDAVFPKGSSLILPAAANLETALYTVSGRLAIEGQAGSPNEMTVAKPGQSLSVEALEDSRVMLLGGEPVGERQIFWNFVTSSSRRMTEAKADWALGPRPDSLRFKPILGDDREFIPLPEEPPQNPKGTVM